MREELQQNIQRFKNFMNFAQSFFRRNNPLKALALSILSSLKYHKHQLYKMESLIAENNEHTFLKGKNLNETR